MRQIPSAKSPVFGILDLLFTGAEISSTLFIDVNFPRGRLREITVS